MDVRKKDRAGESAGNARSRFFQNQLRERDKMVATPYDSFLIISKTINETM